jgi:hypothetical protein
MCVVLGWTNATFVREGKQFESGSDGGDSGSKKLKPGHGGGERCETNTIE